MPSVALIGDATTTTAMALATTWSSNDDIVVVEADPRGGSLAAWFDMPVSPSLSSIVASLQRPGRRVDVADDGPLDRDAPLATFDSMVRRTPGGLRFVPAPFTEREATRSIAEASTDLFRSLARAASTTVLFDAGDPGSADLPRLLGDVDVVAVVHRQRRDAARAGAVRLERCAELLTAVRRLDVAEVHLVVVGDRPFDPEEMANHCGVSDPALHVLGHDPLAASVLAGGAEISARRLARQPLMRSARAMGTRLAAIPHTRSADIIEEPLR